MRMLVVHLIADNAPPKPLCFESQDAWAEWLVAAHEAGIRVVRRVDINQKSPNRSTHFEVLPTERIDICRDCTPWHRARMHAVKRCSPPEASSPPALVFRVRAPSAQPQADSAITDERTE